TVAPHFFRIKVVDIDSDPRMDCTVRLRVRSSKTVFPTGVQKNRITDKDGLAYWTLDVGLYKFQVDCDGLGESSWVNGEMRHGQGALEPCQQDTGNIIMFDLKPQMPGVPHTENIRATF